MFSQSKIVLTKKPHRCWECGKHLPTGCLVKYSAWHYDGDFGHGWFCSGCVVAHRIAQDESGGEPIYQGTAWDEMDKNIAKQIRNATIDELLLSDNDYARSHGLNLLERTKRLGRIVPIG